jgi:hypothetical protein
MAIKYNGVNLSPPDPIQYKPYTGGFSITDAINLAQTGQNQANNANNQRYGQGLNVLSKGYNQGAGFISGALNDIKNVGASQLADINQREKSGIADVQQSAIGRGIGNTTVMDTMSAIPQRSAELARLSLADQQAQSRSNIRLQQAGQANAGANSISNFIANRNDIAPSIGDYAGLVSAASQAQAANTTPKKTTITSTQGSINHLNTSGGSSGGGGGALGSNTAIQAPQQGQIPQEQPPIPNTPNTPTPNTPPVPNTPPTPNTPNTPPPPIPNQPPPTPNTPNTPCATQSTDPSKCGYISVQWSGCSDPNVGSIQKMIHMCKGYA